MKFSQPLKLTELASLLSAKPVGDPDFLVTGMNEIHMVEAGDLTFVDHPKYYAKALNHPHQ
jgi:UDP-3-O-[3-hydroxymyristoyl] glucosamine N-acyltransferase